MPFRKPILQTRRRQCISLLLLLSGVAALAGCASYQVGQASLYRTDIQTVYVPMFESNTLRRHLGPWVTEAVIKRIESDTPYKVVHTATADSILTGRLLNVEKEVLSEDPFDEARDIGTSFVLHITWYARNGEILMQSRINASSHFIPESGQSEPAVSKKRLSVWLKPWSVGWKRCLVATPSTSPDHRRERTAGPTVPISPFPPRAVAVP